MKKKKYFFTSFIPLLFTVSKLYYTYYHVMLLMVVCIVLIWFLLTVLQESSNLDAIFIVCRKIKNKISKLVFMPTPPPPFFLTLPLQNMNNINQLQFNAWITVKYRIAHYYHTCTVQYSTVQYSTVQYSTVQDGPLLP